MPPVSRSFDLSGFNVRLDGLDAGCAAVIDEAWGPFAGQGGIPVLNVRARFEGAELPAGTIDPSPLQREIRGRGIGYASSEGRIDVDEEGRAEAVVGRGNVPTRAWGLMNLVLPALAWRLPAHGALIVHCGAVLVGGRGFALIGRAGAGKSTFTEQAAAGGAVAVGEDLNLLVRGADGWSLAGSPLRKRFEAGAGRWPLAAMLLPRHGAPPALETVSRLRLSAQLQANLPYVGDCLAAVAGGLELIESLDRVPALELTYPPDPSFVPLLERWPD